MRGRSAVRWLALISALVVAGCSGHGDPDPLFVTEPCKFLTPDDAGALLGQPVHVPFRFPTCTYSTTPGYTSKPGQATLSVQVQRRVDKADLRRATTGGATGAVWYRAVHHPVSGLGVPTDWSELSLKRGVKAVGTLVMFTHGFEIRIIVGGVPDDRATAEQTARTLLLRVPKNANACAVHLSKSEPTYVPRGCAGRRSPLPPAGT